MGCGVSVFRSLGYACGKKNNCGLATGSVTAQAVPALPRAFILQRSPEGEVAGGGCLFFFPLRSCWLFCQKYQSYASGHSLFLALGLVLFWGEGKASRVCWIFLSAWWSLMILGISVTVPKLQCEGKLNRFASHVKCYLSSAILFWAVYLQFD